MVRPFMLISLDHIHGVGNKGVHKRTYGRFVKDIQITSEGPEQLAFEAVTGKGTVKNGLIWFHKYRCPDTQNVLWEVAVIEIEHGHVSAVCHNFNRIQYLVGFKSQRMHPFMKGVEYLAWTAIARAVFDEDRLHIQKNGYGHPINSVQKHYLEV